MKFDDLSEDQRVELKQRILTERNEARGEGTSYGELADADDLVSDDDLESWYGGTEFVSDDFTCGQAADRDGVLDEIKSWAERELRFCVYAKHAVLPIRRGLNGATTLGIEWARKRLLEHIEAVLS